MKTVKLEVKDGASGAVNDLLKELLLSGKLGAVLAPCRVPSGGAVFPALVSDPEKLDCDVFSPYLPVSTASMVSKLTRQGVPGKPVGVVLRQCQIRALVELVKLNQANLENIIIIGVDCPGTFDAGCSGSFSGDATEFILKNYLDGAGEHLRSACLVCRDPVPEHADITIGLFGSDIGKEIMLLAGTGKGEEVLEGMKAGKESGSREKAVAAVRKARNDARAAFVKERGGHRGVAALTEFYARCVNCHNCMEACPVCYCRECLFDSNLFDAGPDRYLRKADRKGLFKMPTDTLLFHVGRMNHMITSCVECGLCEQACPMDIPLMEVLVQVAENAQKELSYTPGADLEGKTPMCVFDENEFTNIGE